MSEGRVALVTGASGALGRAAAVALAQSGHRVWLLGRSQERLMQTKDLLGSAALGALSCDITDEGAVKNTLAQVLEAGAVHVLVNNAGIVRDDLLMRMSPEDWDAVISTNLRSAFFLTQGVLRHMMRERFGRIINVTSVVGAMGNPGQCNYAAAKAGLVGMTKSLAAEVGRKGVTVNCVAPGFIESDMTNKLSEEIKAAWVARTPAGRIGAPEDIGHAVAFLASEGAGYITGHVLHVNGGAYCA